MITESVLAQIVASATTGDFNQVASLLRPHLAQDSAITVVEELASSVIYSTQEKQLFFERFLATTLVRKDIETSLTLHVMCGDTSTWSMLRSILEKTLYPISAESCTLFNQCITASSFSSSKVVQTIEALLKQGESLAVELNAVVACDGHLDQFYSSFSNQVVKEMRLGMVQSLLHQGKMLSFNDSEMPDIEKIANRIRGAASARSFELEAANLGCASSGVEANFLPFSSQALVDFDYLEGQVKMTIDCFDLNCADLGLPSNCKPQEDFDQTSVVLLVILGIAMLAATLVLLFVHRCRARLSQRKVGEVEQGIGENEFEDKSVDKSG